MGTEEEIHTLSKQLCSLNNKMVNEINKIGALRVKIHNEYRRRYKNQYETERTKIMDNIRRYGAEMDGVKIRLARLGA